MEIDSLPTEIDEVERKILQAEIEKKALQKDDAKAAKERLKALEKTLAELQGALGAMKTRWKTEKDAIATIRDLKKKVDETKVAAEHAERQGDLNKAAELRYGTLLKLQKDLEAASARLDELQKNGAILREKVDEEDIAADRLEVDRHPRLEDGRGRDAEAPRDGRAAEAARHRPGRGRRGRVRRRPPRARRDEGPEAARSARSSSSARRASARPSSPARSPSSSSTTRTRWSASTCPSTRRSTRSPG